MFNFIFQKILNKKWMVISLLIGNLLMVAVAAANPMYSQAVLQRTLVQEMSDYLTTKNKYPGTIIVRNNYSPFSKEKSLEGLQATEDMLGEMVDELGVTVLEEVRHLYRNNVRAVHEVKVEDGKNEMMAEITSYSNFEDHIQITHGRMYSDEIKDHVIEVVVNERTLVENNLILDEVLELAELPDANGVPYKVKIVGIFEHKTDQDPYWVSSPSYWKEDFVIAENIFREILYNPANTEMGFTAEWHTVMDYTAMRADKVEQMLEIVEKYEIISNDMKVVHMGTYFQETLEAFVPVAQKLNTTILVLQVPIFVLLAAFIFMVSRQMLEIEQNEISVFKSRGAAKNQIIYIYLLQSLIIAGVGILGGIPLGVLICKILGASNAFLEFVQRTALPVEVGPMAWILALGAALFSVGTMVLPVLRFADVNIVDHKRRKNRAAKRPWWQLVFLDVVLLGAGLYGLYSFKGQEEFLAQQVLEGASLDPMLYFSSSIFMLGAGLLILRLLPWLIKLVFVIGKKWWPPAIYASFLRIQRSNNNQGFLVVFLILTVAMGIFNTQTARTINANGEEKIRYVTGADVVLREKWGNNEQQVAEDTTGTLELSYVEPDFGKYQQMEGVKSATKVQVETKVSVSVEKGKINNATVMGINTKEFGETAWFKESLMSVHWYKYLNIISQNANAILVSSNFKEIYGYKVGDALTYTNNAGDSTRGIIYGFVDYWPSYSPVTISRGSDGVIKETDNFLIVAHLSQLQAAWGIRPYQVWMDVEGSTQFLYDYAQETGTKFTVFKDTAAEIVDMKNDPVFQGTNGILTIGFIIVLLLCATGFLIYWILSIQSRTLQFGIFRAMGMSKNEIWSMLLNEQFFISGMSILGGVLVGRIGANLYVPLIQIAYSSADKVIPLEIVSQASDFLRLGIVIGLMIVICLVVLGALISKIKIAQALKLGED
ncbi:MAG: FtsX-like permease family protein [Firmicutes bacterium]|nr:FtsX-like permease family protein [Bacillota bacterium]